MTAPLSASERQRLRTPVNLWRAMLALLLLVGLMVFLLWPKGTRSDGVHVIDVSGPVAAAQHDAGFPVRAPAGLDDRWRATSTEFTHAGVASGASFRIGYVTPTGHYAEVVQGDDAPDAVAAQYGPLTADGAASVRQVSWDRFRRADDRELLRHSAGKVTVVVTGSASEAELVELAGTVS